MSLASPLHLLALLALPVIAVAHVAARRRRYVLRFPGAALVAGGRTRRRLLAPVLIAASAAATTVAFARPVATVSVPVEKASVMLVTDESGSMSATDVEPSRLDAAASAAGTLLDKVPDELQVGFVGFSSQTNAVVAPTTDHEQVLAALHGLQAEGGTATGDALTVALDRLAARRGRDGRQAPAAIILLSDGKRTVGSDPLEAAQRAKRLGIPISTVALGTDTGTVMGPYGEPVPVPPDPGTLREISWISGGTFTQTADAGRLSDVYNALGSKVGTKQVRRQVSSGFAGAGLVFLLAGLGTGLRRRSRLS